MIVSTSPFTVVDDGRDRSDLALRAETKYRFDHADVSALRRVLLRTCRSLRYAGPVSRVSSLYLDDPTLAACRANLDGVGIRHKTRLRWYDCTVPERTLFFETKWRRHEAVGKRRLELACPAPPFDETLHDLHGALTRSIPPDRLDYLPGDTDPVVLIEYHREHFKLDGTSIRLTLDSAIRFAPQLGRRRLSARFYEHLPGLVLIECKSAIEDRGLARAVLAPLRARPCRFSKYVTACQRLGYATDEDRRNP
ncbi:MAG: polyphosphate polymerase domain-containing protein [Planctomycetes bacterium]|nr:polyphosphate polymerase domain-containing protein [Planctomycetota bacterium]